MKTYKEYADSLTPKQRANADALYNSVKTEGPPLMSYSDRASDAAHFKKISIDHKVKIWPEFFRDIFLGLKTFELRRNDRNYHVDDILILQEFDPKCSVFTGNELRVKVTYMTDNQHFLLPGIVVLGISVLTYGQSEVRKWWDAA